MDVWDKSKRSRCARVKNAIPLNMNIRGNDVVPQLSLTVADVVKLTPFPALPHKATAALWTTGCLSCPAGAVLGFPFNSLWYEM